MKIPCIPIFINNLLLEAAHNDYELMSNVENISYQILDSKMVNGMTAIHLASVTGDVGKVKALLRCGGIDVNQATDNGSTPLHMAAIAHKTDALEYLIKQKEVKINLTDNDGRTALHKAVMARNTFGCYYLIQKGLNVNARDIQGKTALHIAADNGYDEVVAIFVHLKRQPLKFGDINFDIKDNDGNTPLDIAKSKGHNYIFNSLRQ